jgi:hypothetical protein
MKYALGKAALIVLGLSLLTALPASADGPAWGTILAPGVAKAGAGPRAAATCGPTNPCPPIVSATGRYSVASNGCGLRNRGDCAIDISGAKPPAVLAIAFWSVILGGPVTSTSDPRVATIEITHGELGETLIGSLISTPSSASPCWGGGPIAVYYAFIPLSIVNSVTSPTPGNGDYHLYVQSGGSGKTTGEDPWSGSVVYPLFEGASVVIIGSGTQNLGIWAGPGFSGATFFGGPQSYALGFGPLPPATGAVANFVSMYADGQVGTSAYTYDPSLSAKSMTINGVNVAGIGSSINPSSNLNGDTGAPLPRLWDNSEFDIGSMGVFSSTTSQMNISLEGANDCITPIAHVLAYN